VIMPMLTWPLDDLKQMKDIIWSWGLFISTCNHSLTLLKMSKNMNLFTIYILTQRHTYFMKYSGQCDVGSLSYLRKSGPTLQVAIHCRERYLVLNRVTKHWTFHCTRLLSAGVLHHREPPYKCFAFWWLTCIHII
jgi:hypothetical protein